MCMWGMCMHVHVRVGVCTRDSVKCSTVIISTCVYMHMCTTVNVEQAFVEREMR